MCDSVQPHRRQPTRLPCPWGSPGKNTGVGWHFLLQCMKVKSESEVAQSCLILSDPMDYGLTGSSFHGIFQARVLEWGAIAFSLGSTTDTKLTEVTTPTGMYDQKENSKCLQGCREIDGRNIKWWTLENCLAIPQKIIQSNHVLSHSVMSDSLRPHGL